MANRKKREFTGNFLSFEEELLTISNIKISNPKNKLEKSIKFKKVYLLVKELDNRLVVGTTVHFNGYYLENSVEKVLLIRQKI
ncbi:MAG: hypothetical protein ACRCYT_07220 [Cetobacterium sp.]